MNGRTTTRLAPVFAVLLLAAACGGSDTDADANAALDSAATAPAAAGPTLTDPQIAMVAVVANSADSAGGVQAQQKATNPDVKNFGETMVIDHGNVNKEATALVTKLNVTPEESDVSRQLKASHDSASAALANLSGAEYDRAYIAHEVTMHQNLLNALDQQLIPGAQNAELKALLEKVRPAVQAHLQRAQQVQQALSATAAAGT